MYPDLLLMTIFVPVLAGNCFLQRWQKHNIPLVMISPGHVLRMALNLPEGIVRYPIAGIQYNKRMYGRATDPIKNADHALSLKHTVTKSKEICPNNVIF
jgi:hypothetical protein